MPTKTTPLPKIGNFTGRYRFLSNFFIEPDRTHVEGEYQAAKCIIADDALRISLLTPTEAKKQGQLVLCRADWNNVRVEVMHGLVLKKFTDHLALRAQLMATGDAELIEGNSRHDTFWGRCRCNVHKGEGWNELGKVLMRVREELRSA